MTLFAKTYVNTTMSAPERLRLAEADAVFYSAACEPESPNEDSAALWQLADGSIVCLICDGAGGHSQGDEASRAAVAAMGEALRGSDPIVNVLEGFDAANDIVLGLGGAATTMIVALVREGTLRTFHAGDSAAWLIGPGGRVKHRTIGHNPLELGVEAGLPRNTPALRQNAHVITNYVGSQSLRVDVSQTLTFAPGDTLLLSSDGLLDALSARAVATQATLTDLIEAGEALSRSVKKATDDCAFVLLRPHFTSAP